MQETPAGQILAHLPAFVFWLQNEAEITSPRLFIGLFPPFLVTHLTYTFVTRVKRVLSMQPLVPPRLLRMVLAAKLLASVPLVAVAQTSQEPLTRGMVISHSVRIEPAVYNFTSESDTSGSAAVVIVRGSNITVDFTGVELRGSSLDSSPDAAKGIALLVDGGENVRIRGLRARGYKIAILARGTKNLFLEENDLSYNWKPRLFSLVEHESLVDWLSYHRNENREWMRFGAGIYLENVTGGHVLRNKVEQGMNGLLMHNVNSLRVAENNFSYNSALGIGMYRSSDNVITGNRVEFNVRGYSHGFFKRGQDSAGILMYEQSSGNIVAGNSVTHGGDGLFLWAGNSTMDTGEGGANDNLFYDNDFSYAPTNGMEATFSRNDFINNRIAGSDHGLWGGYSFSSRVIGNCFNGNRIGIAIEHGQDNSIIGNRFDGDNIAIRLWANESQPSGWGYPTKRDTRSRDYRIAQNAFAGNQTVMRVERTINVDTARNFTDSSVRTGCSVSGSAVPQDVLDRLPADILPRPITVDARRDRSAIVVDEWGPFDWRSPKLWPIDSVRAERLKLRVVGPPGDWTVVNQRGVSSLSQLSGKVGDTIVVVPMRGADLVNWEIDLFYVGTETVSPSGLVRAAGAPYIFSYGRFEPVAEWEVKFFDWNASADSGSDPRSGQTAIDRLLTATPVAQRKESRIDYMWFRPTVPGLPQSKFLTDATATVNLPAGEYTIRTISDDAVRVWVDNELVIDHWTPHESSLAYAVIGGGKRTVRVQHLQVDGWTELRVEFLRGIIRQSMGSDGPH